MKNYPKSQEGALLAIIALIALITYTSTTCDISANKYYLIPNVNSVISD